MKKNAIILIAVFLSLSIIIIIQWIAIRDSLFETGIVSSDGKGIEEKMSDDVNERQDLIQTQEQIVLDGGQSGIVQENFTVNLAAIDNLDDTDEQNKISLQSVDSQIINQKENARGPLSFSDNNSSDVSKHFPASTTQSSSDNIENKIIANVTDWKRHFYSQQCMRHRMAPVGRMRYGTVGQGQRARCADLNPTEESRKEIFGSVDVSLTHKAIYIPVMKAGTQMFQEVFKKRFGGKRIEDYDLQKYIGRKTDINSFFVFTFVREPFSIFRSAYGEVSLYAANARVRDIGFAKLNQTSENEPMRAIESLRDVAHGVFTGLVPAHMHTQLWKITRCFGKLRRGLPIHFIGHVENMESDWREIERRLNVPHQPLPIIHASAVSNEHLYAKKHLKFDPVPEPGKKGSRFSPLTAKVCEYYASDFDCFGYDRRLCGKIN